MKKRFSKVAAREIALLFLPVALILALVWWFKIRQPPAPVLVSKFAVAEAIWNGNEEIIGLVRPRPTPRALPSQIPTFARWNVKSGENLAEVPGDAGFYSPQISPDGKWLVGFTFSGKKGPNLGLRAVNNGFFVANTQDCGLVARHGWPDLAWKSDSSGVFFIHPQKCAFWNIQNSTFTLLPTWKTVFGDQFPAKAVFSPDGKWVAFSQAHRELEKPSPYRANTKENVGYYGDEIQVCSWPGLKPHASFEGDGWEKPHFTANGKSVLTFAVFKDGFTPVSAHIARLDLATRKTTFVKIQGEPSAIRRLERAQFSPDGQWALLFTRKNEKSQTQFFSTRSGQPTGAARAFQPTVETYSNGQPFGRFSPDGQRFLNVTDRGIEILKTPPKNAN